jgi:hypothetical protein
MTGVHVASRLAPWGDCSLGAGTDGASGWFTILVLLSALPIVVLLALRTGFTQAQRYLSGSAVSSISCLNPES